MWRHVDQLDLVRVVYHAVRHPFPDLDAGDVRDNVRQALQVLNVDSADDGDTRLQQVLHILPAFFVFRAWSIGMRQFIHQGNRWVALDDGIGVHLLDDDALIWNFLPRHDLQASGHLGRPGTRVRFEKADHHVSAALLAPMQLFERRIGLAYARRNPQIDTVSTARAGASLTPDFV